MEELIAQNVSLNNANQELRGVIESLNAQLMVYQNTPPHMPANPQLQPAPPPDLASIMAATADRIADSLARLTTRSTPQGPPRLPEPFLRAMKPTKYCSSAKSGKWVEWIEKHERALIATGLDPLSTDARTAALCREALVSMLDGEAFKGVSTWSRQYERDPMHPVFTYAGLKQYLHDRFVVPEDILLAKSKLFQLVQGTLTARQYSDLFESVLQETGISPDQDMLVDLYLNGLHHVIRTWVLQRHVRPTLVEAITAACAVDPRSSSVPVGVEAQSSSQVVPMELDRLAMLSLPTSTTAVVDQMAAIQPRQSEQRLDRRPLAMPDPRQHPMWPQSVHRSDRQIEYCFDNKKCCICYSKDHRWKSCPELSRPVSPAPARGRSPSFTAQNSRPASSRRSLSPKGVAQRWNR